MLFLESQKRVIKQLTKLIIKERISHAFLFDGEKQCQKLDTAYYFTKALLCSNLKEGKPCLECDDCSRVDSGNHPNVTYIEANGLTIKKDQIKELQKVFSVSGLEENRRVYILNNVEFLTTQAANSLLKFLEEPQENVHAILLTDNMHQVINTIVSRCQIINFVKPDIKVFIQDYLDDGHNPERVILASLVTSPGEELDEILEDEVFENLVSAVKMTIREFSYNKKSIICELPELWFKSIDSKKNNLKAIHSLVYFYRDVLSYKLGSESEYFVKSNSLINEIGDRTKLEEVLENINIIFDAKKKLESNVNNKLVIDQLFLKLKGC